MCHYSDHSLSEQGHRQPIALIGHDGLELGGGPSDRVSLPPQLVGFFLKRSSRPGMFSHVEGPRCPNGGQTVYPCWRSYNEEIRND